METIDRFTRIVDAVLQHQGEKTAFYAKLLKMKKINVSRYLKAAVKNKWLKIVQKRYFRGERLSEITESQAWL